jgi:hypothetical protein
MAVDTSELTEIYSKFLTDGVKALQDLQLETQMEDEALSAAASNVIIGAMANSIQALETIKKIDLIGKDLLLKDQELLAQQIKNGGIHFDYTYDTDGNILTKTLVNGTGKSFYEAQLEKEEAETALIKEQNLQLGYSVTYNNRLKATENYGNTLGQLGMGGLNVSAGMWTVYFNMLNDVYTNFGDTPVVKTISVPAAAALVLTKVA